MFVTGLVLAAGGSMRLGEAKQLLPYRGADAARRHPRPGPPCGFDQLLVTLGGAADEVARAGRPRPACRSWTTRTSAPAAGRRSAPPSRRSTRAPTGSCCCSATSPASAPPTCAGSPRRPTPARRSAATTTGWAIRSGSRRDVFAELADLHGDKAVWKLLHSGRLRRDRGAASTGRCRSTWTPGADYERAAGRAERRRSATSADRRGARARRRRLPGRRRHGDGALPRRCGSASRCCSRASRASARPPPPRRSPGRWTRR